MGGGGGGGGGGGRGARFRIKGFQEGGGGKLFAGCKLIGAPAQSVPNNYISYIEN